MLTCVTTILHGSIGRDLFSLSGSLMYRYAKRCGAELLPIWLADHEPFVMLQQLCIADLLNTYDRVLYLDADVLVRSDTPDLFKLVPETHFAAHDECASFNDLAVKQAHDYMLQVTKDEDIPCPDTLGRFFNYGVLLFGKRHADLFAQPKHQTSNVWLPQALLNLRLFLTNTPIYHLPKAFNCSPGLTTDRHYYKSNWVIHYAGMGCHLGEAQRLSWMRRDLAHWKELGFAVE